MTRVLVSMPTIAGREKLARDVLDTLLRQLGPDDLFVVHRNGSKVQHDDPRVRFVDRPKGTGPLVRFALREYPCMFLLTVDDDLRFPRNYVLHTLKMLKLQKDRALSYYARCWYGSAVPVAYPPPFRYAVNAKIPGWTRTTYGGSGVAAFHGAHVSLLDPMDTDNEAIRADARGFERHDDLWWGMQLTAAHIPILRPPTGLNWIKPLVTGGRTLFDAAQRNRYRQRMSNFAVAWKRGWKPWKAHEAR